MAAEGSGRPITETTGRNFSALSMALLAVFALLSASRPPPARADHGLWRPSGTPTSTVSGTRTLLDGPECHTAGPPTYCGKVLRVRFDGTTSLYDPEATGKRAGNDVDGGWTPAATMINTGRGGHTATVL